MKTPLWGKVDFHLHSYASNVTDYYAANAFSLPESYSDPMKIYRLLKERGMTLVTLTDHNSIDGVRELLDAGKSDVFISAEMTTTFPEDGCNIHVTVANMTEAQFAEIHRLRTNIYEMIAYVDGQIATEGAPGGRENRLAYFMTHPLMSTQNRPYGREGALAIEHVEKALLLCSTFEVQNGSRTKALNDLTLGMLEALDRPTIERLACKHGIEPKGDEPWRKGIVGGSDDHAGINPGRTWTEFPHAGRPTANDVVDAIRRRETRPGGGHGGPITLAHSVLKLLYEGSTQNKASGAKVLSIGGPVHALLSLAFDYLVDDKRNLNGEDNYVWMQAKGSGQFVGVTMSVMQNQDGWWGEGDDMFFVDDDATPAISGTGSEDYFLGAWDFGGKPFSYQLYGAPVVGPELAGSRSSVYRFHLDAPIPFRRSFKATIEHGNANHRSDNYYSVAYWYQAEPHAPFPPLPPVDQRLPVVQQVGGPGNANAVSNPAAAPARPAPAPAAPPR